MPSAHIKHWWLYLNLKPHFAQHVGKRFYGLVWGRWPVLAWFIDDTWYEPATSAGLCAIGFVECGVFIEHKPRHRLPDAVSSEHP